MFEHQSKNTAKQFASLCMKNKFPPGFLFGSATSAHQIEGHLNNDWSRWEKTPGKISDGSTSAVSADS
ncbi:MAG: family 1 glycosylhydrolase, partial [Lutibacter sp.]|nr:family 1 glycosylhydrolase [Lutibacter sp.]